jgi:hypothetical protein
MPPKKVAAAKPAGKAKAKGYVFLSHNLIFLFVHLEPELSQKTFSRSKLEMLKL